MEGKTSITTPYIPKQLWPRPRKTRVSNHVTFVDRIRTKIKFASSACISDKLFILSTGPNWIKSSAENRNGNNCVVRSGWWRVTITIFMMFRCWRDGWQSLGVDFGTVRSSPCQIGVYVRFGFRTLDVFRKIKLEIEKFVSRRDTCTRCTLWRFH